MSASTAGRRGSGLGGQFMVGALLGGVWSPCVGPTLGAAVSLASSSWAAAGSESGAFGGMLQATSMMFAFGVGSAIPLIATAYASRRVRGSRGKLLSASASGRRIFAGALVTMGAAVFAGFDKLVETAVLNHLPDWWITLIAGV
jgi:cytochrome c biogenesis protein CcdA